MSVFHHRLKTDPQVKTHFSNIKSIKEKGCKLPTNYLVNWRMMSVEGNSVQTYSWTCRLSLQRNSCKADEMHVSKRYTLSMHKKFMHTKFRLLGHTRHNTSYCQASIFHRIFLVFAYKYSRSCTEQVLLISQFCFFTHIFPHVIER